MDLLTLLFRLPFLPVTGLIRLGEVIRDQAETELHHPASARRQLEEAEQAMESGEMSEGEVAEVQQQALDRVVGAPGQAASEGPAGDSPRR